MCTFAVNVMLPLVCETSVSRKGNCPSRSCSIAKCNVWIDGVEQVMKNRDGGLLKGRKDVVNVTFKVLAAFVRFYSLFTIVITSPFARFEQVYLATIETHEYQSITPFTQANISSHIETTHVNLHVSTK